MAKKDTEVVKSIRTLYNDYISGKLSLPLWQRDGKAWDKKKHEAFHATLYDIIQQEKIEEGDDANLETSFYTFRIKGEGGHKKLNDGGNRLESIRKFLYSNRFGDKKELELIRASVQHWIYDSEKEAYESYFRINNGTCLTPLELAKGVMVVELKDYKTTWKPIFDMLEKDIAMILARVNSKPSPTRDQQHAYLRDNLGLLCRWLSKDNKATKYSTGVKVFKPQKTLTETLKNTVEQRIVTFIKDNNCNSLDIEKEISSLISVFKSFVATYQTIWREIKSDSYHPNETHLRWLMSFWLYCRWKRIPTAHRDRLIRAIIKNSGGRSSVYHHPEGDEEPFQHCNLALSDLTKIKTVCRNLRFDDNIYLHPPRRKKISNLAEGYDSSHKKSHILDPDGEMIPEPASPNRARGASPIEDDIFAAVKNAESN